MKEGNTRVNNGNTGKGRRERTRENKLKDTKKKVGGTRVNTENTDVGKCQKQLKGRKTKLENRQQESASKKNNIKQGRGEKGLRKPRCGKCTGSSISPGYTHPSNVTVVAIVVFVVVVKVSWPQMSPGGAPEPWGRDTWYPPPSQHKHENT